MGANDCGGIYEFSVRDCGQQVRQSAANYILDQDVHMRMRLTASALLRAALRLRLPVFLGLLFFGAMIWAKDRDPFRRMWFKVKAPGWGKADCIALLPKTAARPLPVVIYLYGSGGSLIGSGNELRQMAEMGLAIVGIEDCQTNEAAFDAQFSAFVELPSPPALGRQNRVGWVGFSLGAQRMLFHSPCAIPRASLGSLCALVGAGFPNWSPKSNVQSPKSSGGSLELEPGA